jgi:GH25 family lysozyme M1 (1,4-beta-N-acetylmuramidase)
MITFPDVSSYQAGLRIQPGTQIVIAKATEGTSYEDPSFADFKAQAAAVGAVFSGYHFLHGGNPSGQAVFCHSVAGSVPVMVDVEANGASFNDCLAFIDAMYAFGGRVWGAYIPHWYWQQIGSPDLTALIPREVVLISSNYSSLSGGAGNQPYGGMTPAVWQYTDSASYSGKSIDMNAFQGTAAELAAIIMGENDMDMNTPVPFSTNVKGYFDQTGGPGFGDQMLRNFPQGGTAPFGTVDSWGAMSARAAYLKSAEVDRKLDELTRLVQQLLAK